MRMVLMKSTKKLDNSIFDKRIENRKIKRIGDYINSSTKIEFECLIDGHKWFSRPQDIKRGFGCPKCSNHIELNDEIVDNKLKEKNIPILRLDTISSSRQKIKWKCLIDGNIWEDKVNNIINCIGKFKYFGCKVCRKKERVNKFNERIDNSIKNKNIKRFGEFKNSKEKIDFYCNTCNNSFSTSYACIVNSNTGCPYCKLKGETFIKQVLEKYFSDEYLIDPKYIVYKQNKDKRFKYIVDFCLKNSKEIIFIEYNGQQHYQPSRFTYLISEDKSKENFKKQKERDSKLYTYCKENNIKFIEIPHWIHNYDENKTVEFIKNKIRNNL